MFACLDCHHFRETRTTSESTDKFHAANNTFRDLELEFDELSSLYIENNTNLEPILLATT